MEHRPIEMCVEEEAYRFGYMQGTGRRLVVSLSGVGKKRHLFPNWDFVETASDGGKNHVLLVSDKARSWFNSMPMVEEVVDKIEQIKKSCQIEEVVAIGNSMGGTMALLLPQYTAIDNVVALSPQFSVHPEIVPEETRWRYWRKRIGTYHHETIGEINSLKRQYFILHGGVKSEAPHWTRFPSKLEVYHYILGEQGHRMAAELKQAGILREVMTQAIERRPEKAVMLLVSKFQVGHRSIFAETSENLIED